MDVARPVRGPLPWDRMARAALGVGVPLAAGLITGGITPGVLVAMGGLVGALADRSGPYPLRVRGTILAGAGAAVGLVLGAAAHGRSWPAVVLLTLVAGASALTAAGGATWSVTALCLLVFAVLGSGPLGALDPWWLPTVLLAAGVCWSLLLLLPEWGLRSRTGGQPQPRVARPTGASVPTPGRGTFPRRLPALARRARLTFGAVSGPRLMLCVAVAAVVSEVLPLGRSFWLPLAVALALKPDLGSCLSRVSRYAGATVVGAVIAALIVAGAPPEVALLAPVMVLAALLPLGRRGDYGLSLLVLTPLLVLLLQPLSPGGPAPAESRLVDIVLGCAVVLGIGYAPWPWAWHADVPRAFARAVDRAADYLDSTLPTSVAANAAAAQARAHHELAALRVEFRRAMAEPEGARRRVLAWRPAADALERLLDAVTAIRASGEEPAPPTEVAQVNEVLREIAAAARAGGPPPEDPSLSAAPPLAHVTESLRGLLRTLRGVGPAGGAASVVGPTRLPGRGE